MKIVPIKELRYASKIAETLHKEPVFITKNGYGDMVVVSLDMIPDKKYLDYSERISLRDLQKTNDVSILCHEESKPVVVTYHGHDIYTIMSIEVHEKIFNQ